MPETRALSEANLRTIIETIPQYVWRTNPDGSGDYFSERFCQFVGKSMDEVLGWGWFALIHPDDQPAV
ncbi:MAG: PAS domain S-box protein, partial [Proteobacteria bacterium]